MVHGSCNLGQEIQGTVKLEDKSVTFHIPRASRRGGPTTGCPRQLPEKVYRNQKQTHSETEPGGHPGSPEKQSSWPCTSTPLTDSLRTQASYSNPILQMKEMNHWEVLQVNSGATTR